MIKDKILINSAPRSGTAWLQFILYIYNVDYLHTNKIKYGPNIYSPSFIIRSHIPVTLLAKFDNVTQTTILRDPLDLMPSIITKSMSGLGNSIIGGVPQPHEYNYVSLERLIIEQFNVYKNYSYGIEKNIKNLKPFTFEQVTTDIEYVIKHLLNTKADNKDIDRLKESAKERIWTHKKEEESFNNAVPIDKKPDVYYKVKDMILNNTEFDEIQKIYEDSKSLILDEQTKW